MNRPKEFLNLIKESDAAVRGSQVTEKIHHSIYKKIQSLSSIPSIRRGNVYTLEVPIQELQILDLPRSSYLSALRNLINDKLIAQLCIFYFYEEKKELKLKSCYISLPIEEGTHTQQLYFEVILFSVKSIRKFVESKKPITKQELLKDLELDFKSNHKPPIEKLSNTIFDPAFLIIPTVFDISPEPEVITSLKKDLREELLRQNLFLEIYEYGLMQLRDDELLIRFEAADEYMRSRVAFKYKMDPAIKSDLNALNLEESAYYIEPFATKTSEFSRKIAESLKQNITSKMNTIRFPGMLSVEIVRSLSDRVEEVLQQQDKNELYKQVQYYLDKLKSLARSPGGEIVIYMTQEEIEHIHPKVVETLTASRELMYIKWNLRNTIMHVFAYKEPEIFHKIVDRLLKAKQLEGWKVLALKFLIEQYENEFPNLFDNLAFKESYGKLLRKVYIHYMPWYFKILIYINFPWFQDQAFQSAKEKILKEQEVLEKKNTKILEQKKLQQVQEKKEKLARAQDISTVSRIIDKVYHLLSSGKLPSIRNVLGELTGWEEKQLMEFLERQNFVLFSVKDTRVVLYPKNLNWKIYARKILQIVEQLLDSNSSILESNRVDFIKIRSFIATKLQGELKGEQVEDPYHQFREVVEKHKREEQRKQQESIEEIEI